MKSHGDILWLHSQNVTSKATNEAGEVGSALRWRQGHRWRSLDGTGRCFYGGTMGFNANSGLINHGLLIVGVPSK